MSTTRHVPEYLWEMYLEQEELKPRGGGRRGRGPDPGEGSKAVRNRGKSGNNFFKKD